jgi:hypothetical protein
VQHTGAGYTTLDFTLQLNPVAMPDSVSILRMIEQRARFAGWLNIKVCARAACIS